MNNIKNGQSAAKQVLVKPIKGWEDKYLAYSDGRIYSLLRNKFLKPRMSMDGYKRVCLFNDGKRYEYRVHRLIAETFIDNPDNFPQVNHKDENKKNNNFSNLEWCTKKYNMNYGKLKNFHKKEIAKYENGYFKCKYNSLKEAAEINNLSKSSISRCCKGLQKTYAGFTWKYI